MYGSRKWSDTATTRIASRCWSATKWIWKNPKNVEWARKKELLSPANMDAYSLRLVPRPASMCNAAFMSLFKRFWILLPWLQIHHHHSRWRRRICWDQAKLQTKIQMSLGAVAVDSVRFSLGLYLLLCIWWELLSENTLSLPKFVSWQHNLIHWNSSSLLLGYFTCLLFWVWEKGFFADKESVSQCVKALHSNDHLHAGNFKLNQDFSQCWQAQVEFRVW